MLKAPHSQNILTSFFSASYICTTGMIGTTLTVTNDYQLFTTGVAGSGAASNAEIYSIVDCVEDLWQHMFPVIREWDETRRVL